MSQKDIAAAIGESPQLLQGSYRDYNRQKHRLAGHEKMPHGKDANEAAKTTVHLLEPYRKWIKTITTDN